MVYYRTKTAQLNTNFKTEGQMLSCNNFKYNNHCLHLALQHTSVSVLNSYDP